MHATQSPFSTDAWLQSLPFPLVAILAFAGVVLLSMGVLWLAHLSRLALARAADGTGRAVPESKP